MSSIKPFLTLDEQVDLLRQRGMLIDDKASARQVLLSNNYYNIINGYSKFFPMTDDCYINHTSFDEVMRLYLLDIELKQAFLKAILAAESHLKSVFAYRFAEAYHDVRYSYLDIACYDSDKVLSAVQTIHRLSGIINRQREIAGSSIRHYVNTYGNVPIWVLVNYIDFGDLRYMIANAHKPIQNSSAHDMTDFLRQNRPDIAIFPPEYMVDLLKNVNEVRNVCAHNNRLVDFRCRSDSKRWDALFGRYGLTSRGGRRDAYSVYIALQCYTSKTEFSILHNTVRKRLRHFKNNVHSIEVVRILDALGFPADWIDTASVMPQSM